MPFFSIEELFSLYICKHHLSMKDITHYCIHSDFFFGRFVLICCWVLNFVYNDFAVQTLIIFLNQSFFFFQFLPLENSFPQ